MNNPETIRFIVNRIKQLSSLRVPNYDLPSYSHIEEAAEEIISYIYNKEEISRISSLLIKKHEKVLKNLSKR